MLRASLYCSGKNTFYFAESIELCAWMVPFIPFRIKMRIDAPMNWLFDFLSETKNVLPETSFITLYSIQK